MAETAACPGCGALYVRPPQGRGEALSCPRCRLVFREEGPSPADGPGGEPAIPSVLPVPDDVAPAGEVLDELEVVDDPAARRGRRKPPRRTPAPPTPVRVS